MEDTYVKTAIEALWSLAQIGGAGTRETLVEYKDWYYTDSKLRTAIENALAGEAVEPQRRDWPIPAIR